jgi:hypothetical protein
MRSGFRDCTLERVYLTSVQSCLVQEFYPPSSKHIVMEGKFLLVRFMVPSA